MPDELKKLKKAVREKCLECSGGAAAEVELCGIEDCPLFPFRLEFWPSLLDAGNAGNVGADASGAENHAGDTTAPREQFTLF